MEVTSAEADDVTDVSSIETGTLGSQEGECAGGKSEEGTSHVTHFLSKLSKLFLRSKVIFLFIVFSVPEVSDEPIVAGMIPLIEKKTHVMPMSGESETRESLIQQTDVSELTNITFHSPLPKTLIYSPSCDSSVGHKRSFEKCLCAFEPSCIDSQSEAILSGYQYLCIITGGGALETAAGATGFTERTGRKTARA